MSGNTFHAISKGNSIRQAGTLPSAIAQAEDPQQPTTSAYEDIAGGTATSWAVVLTALAEEHQAVEAHLEPFGQALRLSEEIHPNGTIYTQGHFKTPACTWNIAIAQIDIGNASAAMETVRAIERFDPRVILFVGVAGGIKDVDIGDVVAASVVYSYECGKLMDDRTLPRPKLGEADYDLKQRAQAEARKEDWRSRIRLKTASSEKSPKVYVKPIAAGEKVIASRQAEIYDYLREYYDDAIAVEMEGFGFLKAAQQVKKVSAIVIRGISDLLEGKNDDAADSESIRQVRAAHHASAFAFELLAKLDGVTTPTAPAEQIESISFDPHQTLPDHLTSVSIEVIAGGSYYLHAHHGKRSLVERGKFAPQVMQLPKLIESDKNYENLVGKLDEYNFELQNHQACPIGQFLQWLPLQIVSNPSDDTYLMIDDRTHLGIPWELLEVDEVPLGVAMQTIRQCPHSSKADTRVINQRCQGSILAYATGKTHSWQADYRYQRYSEFHEFLSCLQKPQTDYGMVFIDGLGIQESLRHNPTGFIRRSQLFKTRASLVFIHGQLSFEESLALNHSAFLTMLLRYGARGVISSQRQIDPAAAQQVVETFFTCFQAQNSDVPMTVPAMLQQIRQQAYERLNEKVSDEICAFYLATFLYVYYGNPQTMLHLTPASP